MAYVSNDLNRSVAKSCAPHNKGRVDANPFMLARYDRYILGKLMVTFGFFTFILVLVYWINRAILLFNRMVRLFYM